MKIINGLVYTDKQYIEMLEKKIKELEEKNKTFEDYNKDLNNQLEEENNSLRLRLINTEQKYLELKRTIFSGYYIDRVNKAIEYIKQHCEIRRYEDKGIDEIGKVEGISLLKILKGEDK